MPLIGFLSDFPISFGQMNLVCVVNENITFFRQILILIYDRSVDKIRGETVPRSLDEAIGTGFPRRCLHVDYKLVLSATETVNSFTMSTPCTSFCLDRI